MKARRASLGVALLLAACLPAGCARSPSSPNPPVPAQIPEGTSVQHVVADGRKRAFRVFVPEKLRSTTPLVVMMHGWGLSATRTQRQYGWDGVAADEKFVVAYPLGLGRSWNAGGGCCGPAEQSRVDDVAFITAMVERLRDLLPIDAQRIYAAGMSNGGAMAYTLACRTSIFAAIGAVAATQLGECEKPKPTSVIHVHGLADAIIRFDGGPGLFAATPPVATVMDPWLRINRCDEPEQSRSGLVATARSRCADDREVTLVVIDGEGHTWPGHDGSTATWDATDELWRMFERHSRAGASSGDNEVQDERTP